MRFRNEHEGRPFGHHAHRGGPRTGEDGPPHERRGPRRGEDGPLPPRRGGRGRAPRGDVRTAVLLLLAEQPMHGYQLMQAVGDRSDGRWTPSPGAIYPTLNQLEDEGLVTVTADAGRKLVTLTDVGRQHVEAGRDTWPDPFAGQTASGPGADLRGLLEQLHAATRQVARSGSDTQRAGAATVLAEARRSLYLLLADGPGPDA